jgi:integrase
MARKSQRRAPGEGAVYFNRGVWVGRLLLNGKRREVTARTKGELLDRMRRLREEAAQDAAAGEAGKILLVDRVAWWLDQIASLRHGPSTRNRYAEVLRLHLAPRLAGVTLAATDADRLEALFVSLHADGVRGSSALQCRKVLSGTLRHAARKKLIAANPLAEVDRPRMPDTVVEVFTATEVKAILAAAWTGKYAALRRRHAPLFTLALATGMRRGELLGLAWPDIDFAGRSLRVERTLAWDGATAFLKPPKSKRGLRSISLPAFALEALGSHQEAMAQEGRLAAPVFCSKNGTWVDRAVLRVAWANLLRRADVPHRKFHAVRHSHISQLLSQNVPVMEVARRVGDHPATVLSVYCHFIPSGADVAGILDGLYAPDGENPHCQR